MTTRGTTAGAASIPPATSAHLCHGRNTRSLCRRRRVRSIRLQLPRRSQHPRPAQRRRRVAAEVSVVAAVAVGAVGADDVARKRTNSFSFRVESLKPTQVAVECPRWREPTGCYGCWIQPVNRECSRILRWELLSGILCYQRRPVTFLDPIGLARVCDTDCETVVARTASERGGAVPEPASWALSV